MKGKKMVLADRKLFWAAFVVVLTFLVAGFVRSGVEPLTSMAVAEPQPEILILDGTGFSPQEVLVNPGDTVVWRNDMKNVAVLWSPSPNATFTSPTLYTGNTYSYTYNSPGTYKFVDVNFGFSGKVIVRGKQESGSEATAAETSPAAASAAQAQETQAAKPQCASCHSGCYNDVYNCARCSCPCYKDDDCNDNDSCTVDVCSSEPVSCVNKARAGCAQGLECISEGAIAVVNGEQLTCTGSAWVRTPGSGSKSGGGVVVLGAIMTAAAAYAIYSLKKAAKAAKPRKARQAGKA
ncbi:hypothetical protein HYV82_01210 [Candidatus Woesearchaeota archaeon]|nr:hypothetical protein [Candidatus Woesearchaeota archaeon]